MAALNNRSGHVSFLAPLVNDTRKFLMGFAQLELNHVRKEANNVAYRLAHSGVGRTTKVSWFEALPDLILDCLLEDNLM
ncbi:hypothetical protein EV2_033336 [Malus domestica]